ncbi:hypothetical protein LX32DRAFT_46996 [Colletotrichum zoysiae]|uniref:Uncharacterized protein n=1 Tax=Colletotrichum zoysiae TaxID=1216348 RepID=A0AAD9HBN1_9PEZI|nr:hypothetical protein LX32DRAFT_46996 [Colletotrichum zoysiae]
MSPAHGRPSGPASNHGFLPFSPVMRRRTTPGPLRTSGCATHLKLGFPGHPSSMSSSCPFPPALFSKKSYYQSLSRTSSCKRPGRRHGFPCTFVFFLTSHNISKPHLYTHTHTHTHTLIIIDTLVSRTTGRSRVRDPTTYTYT